MELVKITQLSQELGLSSRTLRYYEQAGLIESVRPENEKYRFYAPEAVERLKQILILRKLQIPIKDILRIYQSQDMGVIVETFVNRIKAIEEEVIALSELKRIVNEFLQTMIRNGIKQISVLPLLYEEMDKQLKHVEKSTVTYEQLSDVSERLEKPVDVRIVELKPMRVVSSLHKESTISEVDGFWDWLIQKGIPAAKPGQHMLFEYQDDTYQTIVIRTIPESFVNDGPYRDYIFHGGLFAVGSVYLDDDVNTAFKGMIRYFDGNAYYEVDYTHDGKLRQEPLVESVISPDAQREKVDLFLPVKSRVPNAALYVPNRRAEHISLSEIELANPALWERDIPMDQLLPILNPHYRITEWGEAEYIAFIDKRLLSTGVEVRIPFRVDIEFRVDEASSRFAHGSDEGSIRFLHGNHVYGINMENNSESGLSKQAISFNQPVFGDYYVFPQLGRIHPDVYNCVTWIIGEKHFAVIINGETRYCGVDFPYMATDLPMQPAYPVILGSNGNGKRYFRKVQVSQLKHAFKPKIKGGELAMITKQSNNLLPNIHPLITMHYGENYWFNGCARYVMECLGEPDYDYWFFSGLTGDNLAQVYARDRFRGDGATDYQVGSGKKGRFIEGVFAACGYASTFVSQKDVRSNPDMYLQTLMAYIDKGKPVIRYFYEWGVFVGYEDYGKTLLYLTADKPEPERIPFDKVFASPERFGAESNEWTDLLGFGWCFVGEKQNQPVLAHIYRDVIKDMPRLLTIQTKEFCFGAEAFRLWADEIENGRFEGMKPEAFDDWAMYKIYVCNLATNGSCRRFLERALEKNPDMTFIAEIIQQYKQLAVLWNGSDGQTRHQGECLESLGGGFNVTLEALTHIEKRKAISGKIRECAGCMSRVTEILNENRSYFNP